jgi:PAS domain S-box-containing protein
MDELKPLNPDRIHKHHEAILEAEHCLGCMHQGTVVTTHDGTILETTPAAEQILGVPSPRLKDHNIHDFVESRDVYDHLCAEALRDVKAMNHPFVLATGEGKRKLVNMSIQSTRNGDGVQLVHVFQDCADLRTMEQRLLQAERLATVGRFASQIAHEIRNPLNSISLNLELIEENLQGAGDESRGLIRSVLREMDRLNDIISDYLQFARFPKPQLKRGQVENVVRSAAESLRPPERIQVRVRLAPSTPPVWLDEALLRQVVDNLIRNAIDAIEGNGTVEIETDVLDRFVVIRVKDSGVGIPADVLPKLFEPFFTTKPHGTGLGLAISQQIVFEHNGHLLAESQPGKGSTLSIMLPL